jgi:hypothetical protein
VQANNTQFAGILAETWVCPSFDHETTLNRGWLYNQKVPEVLLIDFNKPSLLMVHKALCSLEPTSTGQTDVDIKAPCEGEDGMWIWEPPWSCGSGWVAMYWGFER